MRLGRRSLFAKSSVTEWLRRKEHLPQGKEKNSPQLDIASALRELESHGETGAACRLFVSEQGEPLRPEAVEQYLRRLLASGIRRLPLAPV